ncbi:hypothetical protein PAHAL_1G378300 [Panicum hallii]|uniref:Geranylgeranyl transferase type II subunit beta n=1 Tax=Panicum hallii TaxID=206008 RepID=A0A2S3GSR5_9POAL|nr:hypothetical protein PAHAL_1G378300 [Panicum hallii]
MSSTRSAPCRSSASSIGSMSLTSTRLLIMLLRCKMRMDHFLVISGVKSTLVFCCVGTLAIAGSLHHIDRDLLGWWLCERQCKDGGLNGRPEKLADVCYSWWVLSSLIMIDRVHWIDKEKLTRFILNCQDKENDGISVSDRPDNAVDIYHTYFGVAGAYFLSGLVFLTAFIDGVPWGEAYGSCLCAAVGCCYQSDFLEKIELYMYEICSTDDVV